MTLLGAAQERGKRLETELKDVDDTVRNQLLATWKELILGGNGRTLRNYRRSAGSALLG